MNTQSRFTRPSQINAERMTDWTSCDTQNEDSYARELKALGRLKFVEGACFTVFFATVTVYALCVLSEPVNMWLGWKLDVLAYHLGF